VPAALVIFACAVLAGPVTFAFAAHVQRPTRPEPAIPAAADDSSRAAHEMMLFLRTPYGGVDNWANLDGVRYYVTYRIPGPDSTKVSEWTESHLIWVHDRPRVRIDNSNDSTVVVVTGDTTYVRRAGTWSTDPDVIAQARSLALESSWLVRMPWNLLDFNLKRRLDPAYVKDGPLSVRIEYGPGQDRPDGTRVWIRFDPPTYAARTIRWYDPRSKGWYLLELTGDQRRYGWTWATHRTLRASDSDGKPGPIILEAEIEDMQLDNAMPVTVLAPPGGIPVRAAPPDSVKTR
jgi:hypothetical protein